MDLDQDEGLEIKFTTVLKIKTYALQGHWYLLKKKSNNILMNEAPENHSLRLSDHSVHLSFGHRTTSLHASVCHLHLSS